MSASDKKIGAHRGRVDAILALNQDTIDIHKVRWNDNTIIIYDQDKVILEDELKKVIS
jgi:2-oxoglutarate/2-oxoacid ferredoxin oxidoreductase subunit alpha